MSSNDMKQKYQNLLIDLLERGVGIVELTEEQSVIPKSAFHVAKLALDLPEPTKQTSFPQVDANDSAHTTGYHGLGAMSARYNAFREGFVWSDGKSFDLSVPRLERESRTQLENDSRNELSTFQEQMKALHELLHDVADQVMKSIAQHLELSDSFFADKYGPDFRSYSQWHIKRFVAPSSTSLTQLSLEETPKTIEWLPTHTDPSLISIIIHDRPNLATPHDDSMGLQNYDSKQKAWKEVSSHSGHNIAIVMAGSVLQEITCGYFRACQHRVVYRSLIDQQQRRMAATLFLRPAPQARLVTPHSCKLSLSSVSCNPQKPRTFAEWYSRTARKYEKAHNQQTAPVTKHQHT
jgi:isopenicillin N synthase-like dioxygenase